MSEVVRLISVIIPVRNRIQLFAPALESVLNQQYSPVEIVVVDDGCDASESRKLDSIISNANQRFPQIPIFVLKGAQHGAAAARNLGFKHSSGVYIQFFDSDDILLDQKLAVQAKILDEDPSLDMVYAKAQFVDDKLQAIDGHWGIALKGDSMDYFTFTWQTMCPLYRREALEKFGLWDEELSINQDWEFCLRYKLLGAKTYFIDEVYAYFRKHSFGNIGTIGLNKEKVKSKWTSTYKIFQLCKSRGQLDKPLLNAFIKRWAYTICMTSKISDKKLLKSQLETIRPEVNKRVYILFSMFQFKPIANFILYIYSKYASSK